MSNTPIRKQTDEEEGDDDDGPVHTLKKYGSLKVRYMQ